MVDQSNNRFSLTKPPSKPDFVLCGDNMRFCYSSPLSLLSSIFLFVRSVRVPPLTIALCVVSLVRMVVEFIIAPVRLFGLIVLLPPDTLSLPPCVFTFAIIS